MAEWFKRGTVNTFYRGSNPLKAYLTLLYYILFIFNMFNFNLFILICSSAFPLPLPLPLFTSFYSYYFF